MPGDYGTVPGIPLRTLASINLSGYKITVPIGPPLQLRRWPSKPSREKRHKSQHRTLAQSKSDCLEALAYEAPSGDGPAPGLGDREARSGLPASILLSGAATGRRGRAADTFFRYHRVIQAENIHANGQQHEAHGHPLPPFSFRS
jgi:hypothetical protein